MKRFQTLVSNSTCVATPGDDKHVIYVWIDALLNYVTALGLAEEEGAGTAGDGEAARRRLAGELRGYWPASVHVMVERCRSTLGGPEVDRRLTPGLPQVDPRLNLGLTPG
jgi:hypothetical protein